MTYNPGGDLLTKDGRTSQFVVFGFTETFSVHLDAQAVALTQAFMLVDLSDTTNWPHTDTYHINIEYIIIEIDPDGSYVGEVKLGFLTSVDATDGDFNQVIDIDTFVYVAALQEKVDFSVLSLVKLYILAHFRRGCLRSAMIFLLDLTPPFCEIIAVRPFVHLVF